MNNKDLEKEFLYMLYEAQINNKRIPVKFEKFEQEIGDVMMHELVKNLHNKGFSNLTSKLGADNHCIVKIQEPLLTTDGIKYVEDLKKPWWKKNFLNIVAILTYAILGIIDRLPKLDAIIDSINKYILKIK